MNTRSQASVRWRRRLPLFALLAGCLGLTAPAWAQSSAPTPPPTGEEDQVVVHDTVTVIGSAGNAARVPGSAFVIAAPELQKFVPTNVHQVLRVVPGVYLREEDGLGTFPRIGIRASSSGRSDRISIMEDGLPAAMAAYANTSAYYFPNVSRMEGIEVLMGPQVLFYGPQTTSGAINLLSTPIPATTTGFLSAEFGDYASKNLRAHYGATLGQFGFLVETVQRETDGFMKKDRSSRGSGNNIQEYLAKVQWNSDNRSQQVDLKLFYGDEYADVSYLGLTDADFRANPNRRYGLSELERMNRGRASVSLRHRAAIGRNTSLSSALYRMKTHRDYTRLNQINGVGIGATGATWIVNNGLANADEMQAVLDGTANTTHPNGVRYANNFQTFTSTGAQLELLHARMTGSVGHLLTAGVRWHHDAPENTATTSNVVYDQINGSLAYRSSSPATPNKGRAEAVSVWIGNRMTIGRWDVLPVVRVEFVETKADVAVPASNANDLSKTTAGIGANYTVSDSWIVLAGVHQGFAPPGSNVPQGSRGEESTNSEAGIRYRRGRVALDVIGFYSDYSNALRNCLVANPCAGGVVEGTEQAGAKRVHGLEIGAAFDLYRRGTFRIPLLTAYTVTGGRYTRASDLSGGVQAGDVLDYTPTHVGSVQIGLEGPGRWKAYSAFTYSDGTCVTTTCGRPGEDARFIRTDSLFTVDVTGAYRLGQFVEAYAKIENLFDERRITHRGADGARGNPARYIGGGLRVTF